VLDAGARSGSLLAGHRTEWEEHVQFKEILKRSIGDDVVINNNEERKLLSVEDDFFVIEGGNTQMRIIEFVPIAQVVKVIRAEYTATNTSSVSIDLTISGGDQRRSGAH
jgi:hypothetical protein